MKTTISFVKIGGRTNCVEATDQENVVPSASKTKVPCEFCNEPCSLEALMRHQVSLLIQEFLLRLFPRYSSKNFFRELTLLKCVMMTLKEDLFDIQQL